MPALSESESRQIASDLRQLRAGEPLDYPPALLPQFFYRIAQATSDTLDLSVAIRMHNARITLIKPQ